MSFRRELDPGGRGASAFLFGPRMTGKTTLLRRLPVAAFFDLLDPRLELVYRAHPERFQEEIAALPKGAVIVVDEVQRVPALLDYVQMGIDRRDQIFLLSGSSARKLRRGQANLLGGRALDLRLHPLSVREIGTRFDLQQSLQFGTLPKIATLLRDGKEDLARGLLASYVTTYLKEEIQAEALTRNLGAFQRFLAVAGQGNGQIIEFANVSRDCAVAASTVKEYYQILEDTLIAFFLWPFDHCERKKRRPKSFFFDCGVVRALQNRLHDPPTPQEKGFLFEQWFVNEVRRIRDYQGKPHEFSYWREREHEVDLLVQKGNQVLMGIECKSGSADLKAATANLFRQRFPGVPLIVASLTDSRRRRLGEGEGEVEILPWQDALDRYVHL
ncbi:MAG: ATP-binding protein [Candidatus Riflebacteria bacterium]|nr:ATP-binding protein [Candidatus Riflebacteria bacterium]